MNTEYYCLKMLFIFLFLGLFSLNISAQKIACGEVHSVVICTDSTVWAWGANDYGQLGDGTFDYSAVPIQVQGLSSVIMVFASSFNSFAITADGSLWGWGANTHYLLGSDTLQGNQNKPVKIPVDNVKKMHSTFATGMAGYGFSYAVTNDGTLWGWGISGTSWFFGDSIVQFSKFPINDTVLQNVVSVGGGGAILALLGDGTVWGWGNNSSGSLGTGDTRHRGNAVRVKNLDNITSFSSNGYETYSLAVRNDGTVWAWGYNNFYGTLGDSTTFNRNEPILIKGINNVRSVLTTSGYSSYALKQDGTVWAWGQNNMGQLGDGTINNRSYPSLVNGLNNVVALEAGGGFNDVSGGGHALVVTSDGKLLAWGANDYGQLGDGTTTGRHTPIQVPGLCEIEVNVPQILNTTEYRIYPNPATNLLHIEFTTITPNKIEIQDIHGRTVYSQTVSPTQNTHEVSLADVSNGVYFVKIYSSEGVVLKKVIKE